MARVGVRSLHDAAQQLLLDRDHQIDVGASKLPSRRKMCGDDVDVAENHCSAVLRTSVAREGVDRRTSMYADAYAIARRRIQAAGGVGHEPQPHTARRTQEPLPRQIRCSQRHSHQGTVGRGAQEASINGGSTMTKALIIGGGIAGPVTAVALQRAGIASVVYEAYAENAGTAG